VVHVDFHGEHAITVIIPGKHHEVMFLTRLAP
jgi:hypothetical protein